jgi:hypothetical protein
MPVNWPPPNAPQWPQGTEGTDLDNFIVALRVAGWTEAAPTNQERTAYFNEARCDSGHPVVGRMIISPEGVRHPAAACNTNHGLTIRSRALFLPWFPFYLNTFAEGE